MSKTSSDIGLATFDKLEIAYEHAYGNNPLKKACVSNAITLLSDDQQQEGQQPRKILDVGCGTGKPVAEMLANAGFDVTGVDVSPKMVAHASSRVKGKFLVADLLQYEPEEKFAGVLIIFSLLQLTAYKEFYDLMVKYANAVEVGGFLVFGSMPADEYVRDKADYDETGTYAVDFPTPFMGVMEKTFFLTARGHADFVTSMGFEVVSDEVGWFQPDDPRCVPEHQQYLIARRTAGTIARPRPEPKT